LKLLTLAPLVLFGCQDPVPETTHFTGSWAAIEGSELSLRDDPAPASAGRGGLTRESLAVARYTLTVAPDGSLLAGWQAGTDSSRVFRVHHWNGLDWSALPRPEPWPADDPHRVASQPMLSIAPDGSPVAAWRERGGLRVRKLGGLVAVHDALADQVGWSDLARPTLDCDGSEPEPGVPEAVYAGLRGTWLVLSTRGEHGSGRPALARFNGSCWDSLGEVRTDDEAVENEAISPAVAATDLDGRPVVAWLEHTDGGSRPILHDWDGRRWHTLTEAPPLFPEGGAGAPALALDRDDRPVLAWLSRQGEDPAAIQVARWDGDSWMLLPSPPPLPGRVMSPTLTVDASNQPVVGWVQVWEDRPVGESWRSDIVVRAWDGEDWQPLGEAGSSGASDTAGRSLSPTLVTRTDGKPVLAWLDDTSGIRQLYLRSWDGSAWYGLDEPPTLTGLSGGSGPVATPRVALDDEGQPVVAWQQSLDGVPRVRITRWSDDGWHAPDGAPEPAHIGIPWGLEPDLDVGPDGQPVVAWTQLMPQEDGALPDLTEGGAVLVRRWTDAGWEDLGTLLDPSEANPLIDELRQRGGSRPGLFMEGSRRPKLALTSTGDPVIAYTHHAPTEGQVMGTPDRNPLVTVPLTRTWQLHVQRWRDGAWEELGGSASSGGVSHSLTDVRSPAVVLDEAERPIVAYAARRDGHPEVHVRRWNGRTWEIMGADERGVCADQTDRAWRPDLTISPSGHPTVAWGDTDGQTWKVAVCQWTGTEWAFLPSPAEGMPEAGPVSPWPGAPSGEFRGPVVSMSTHRGQPVVAWSDPSVGTHQVRVAFWDGASWKDVDGSWESGGVSNSASPSLSPAIVGGDGLCVAWSEMGRHSTEVALRCLVPDAAAKPDSTEAEG